MIRASTSASISATSAVALQFGSFISSGTTLASVTNPTAQDIVLITAPTINIAQSTLDQNNLQLAENLPFLFQPDATPLELRTVGSNQNLILSLTPRVPGMGGNTDATAGLGLSGDALAQFLISPSALATDPGWARRSPPASPVYNTPGVASSKINVLASQQQAQQAFSPFGPDYIGRRQAGGDHDHRPGHRPGGGAPEIVAVLFQHRRRPHSLGPGILRQHQQ